MKDVAIFLCDRTGIMARPWAEAGYECYCIDIQHSIRRPRTVDNVTYIWGDVRNWSPLGSVASRIAFLFAFPPCTHVSSSGARDHRTKGVALLADALHLFSACYNAGRWCGAPFGIENPVGTLSTYMGRPDYYFEPWHYGDPWTKKTCLWTGNGFVMPPREVSDPYSVWPDWENIRGRIHTMPPGHERGDRRSETPPGFARAVFRANAQPFARQAIA